MTTEQKDKIKKYQKEYRKKNKEKILKKHKKVMNLQ